VQTPAISAPPYPERSPLEPSRSFDLRVKKWRRDNAKWEGQRRAVRDLDKKTTPISPASNDPRILP
jgi:hypothetical protein